MRRALPACLAATGDFIRLDNEADPITAFPSFLTMVANQAFELVFALHYGCDVLPRQ